MPGMESQQRRPLHVGINAHLMSGEAGYRSAGIHGYIANLLAHLPDADPDIQYTVFTSEGQPQPHERLQIRRSGMKTGKPSRRVLWEQVVQPWQLRRARVDLHHGMAFVAPAITPCPFVVTVYDLSFLHYPQLFRAANRLYLRTMTRLSCRRARRVIAISESTARDIAQRLGVPPGRIDVAVPGVDARFFAPVDAAQCERFKSTWGLPRRFLLFLGTLEPRKNLVTLLEAYARLPSHKVKLVLAGGEGWLYEDIYRAIERLNLGGAVLTPGYVPGGELTLWYACAEALVYPSVYEGFGLPLLEAMAAGTPVLASDTSSLPEAAGDTGMLIPPQDVDAWTAALARAIDDAAWRAEAGERGQARARTFTWERTAAQTTASYRWAMANTADTKEAE
jgi:glycosyltransferase involved in cell wall biosynthesis